MTKENKKKKKKLIAILFVCVLFILMVLLVNHPGNQTESTSCLKFTAQEVGATIKLNKFGSPNKISLQISTDGKKWCTYKIGDIITLTSVNDCVYIRTTESNATFSKDPSNYYYFSMSKKISASENIMSLIDTSCEATTISQNYVFYRLFSDCETLTSAPNLPAITLANACYQDMFLNCANLVNAPVLPATTLADDCYNSMFYGCTSLLSAPALPATTLAESCYQAMFSNCTNLVDAPELPATTLVSNCYNAMFSGCTNLTIIPELKATTLANSSYNSMFSGCTKIKIHEKQPGEYSDNKYEITIPSASGLTNPVTDMFKGTSGSFAGTPVEGKTYVFDASLSLTADINNASLTHGTVGSYKYTVNVNNFKTNPTTESISITCYFDSALKNKVNDILFTYSISGNTLTISSKETTKEGTYYIVVSDGAASADPIKITIGGSTVVVLNYLKFTTLEDNATIKLEKYGTPNDISLQISTDGTKWNAYTIGDDINLTNINDCVYFRTTTSNATFSQDKFNFYYFSMTKKISASGNIMSLIDNTCESKTISHERIFNRLFNNCTTLVSAPELPATTLAEWSYQSMFSGCTSLVNAPELPATTLAGDCYNSMFDGCTSLVTAPALPATTLAIACYNSMFNGCTSLINAPVLPATTLASYCYNSMFNGCTSLITAPALQAITLKDYCYAGMFANCTSLVNAPALPADTLKEWCYQAMFKNCTSLVYAPTLPATTLASDCYNSMFSGCTSLVTAPALPATTLAIACYNSMFRNCTSLVNIPSLSASTLADYCYNYMFAGCTSLATAPALPVETLANYCYQSMFNGCTSLVNAPVLQAEVLKDYCYASMFANCTSLINAPALPATTLARDCYNSMFYGCTSLVNAPALPATTLVNACYNSMFRNCTSLLKTPELPAETLASYCYNYMFADCTSLTAIPVFKATSLENSAYNAMFSGCTNIKVHEKQNGENQYNNKLEITIPSTSGLTNPVTDMFKGTSGLFNGTPVAGKTYVLDASIALIADENNVKPTHGAIENLKYTIQTTNFIANPTTESISMTYYSDAALKNKVTGDPFTYAVSGNTLTISSKTTTKAGDYYAVVNDDTATSAPVKITILNYLKFIAVENNATIKLNKYGNPNSISLQTSTDGKTWNAYNVGETITLSNINDCVYFRATTSNSTFSKNYSNYYYFSMNNKISTIGSIMSLLDSTLESKTLSGSFIFYKLFADCTTLTSAPELPAEVLSENCYYSMFSNCTSLVSAPALPATSLRNSCYYSMFSNCTNLISAPALPAETLADYCYDTMFSNCTSLVTAPALPAKTLAQSCYNGMFYYCKCLVNAPALPATVLDNYCYESMFEGCANLVSAPALPAETLAAFCYSNMFSGCTNLKSISEIKATSLKDYACYSMFEGCTNIKMHEKQNDEDISNYKFVITIPSTTGLEYSVIDMFEGTSGSFTGTPVAGKTYVLDASLSLIADANNDNPTYGIVRNNKYTIKATNFKNAPTLDSLSVTFYSDSALNNKIESAPFTYSVSGNTLTISSKSTTSIGDYYIVVSCDIASADPIKISVLNYLKFTAVEKNATIKLNKFGNPNTISLQSSTDGKTWKTYNITDTIKLSNVNDYVYFRTTASNASFSKDASNYYYFSMSNKISASGDVLSLIENACDSKIISQNYTFYKLFVDCKTLTTAPELLAETLANSCYQSMFGGCTSLVSAPALPATTLASDCYNSMFHGCSNLVNAPALPAETLKVACYNSMFRNCTSLVSAPALPASTLASYCYNYMFAGCTGLVNAPTLSASTLASYCYNYMFDGCTSLVNAPALPAETLANSCYQSMFSGCTSLVNAPTLPAKTLATNCYYYMFSGCTSLVSAPALPAETLTESCYQSMFSGCTNLVNAPTLASKTLASNCYNSMFHGCSSLVNAPALPATTLKIACYNSMFRNCTSLVSAPALSATTLASYCYNYMFAGCTNLTIIPELKATSFANSSYNSMFSGCTKIKVHEKQSGENANNNKYEIAIPNTSGLTNPVTDMFKGTSGSFTGTPTLGKSYILDASLTLTADKNNTNPTYGTVGSLKYTLKTTNFKTNPTTSTISLTCYSDSALKNKVSGDPFTYTVSGNTLTISSKTTTAPKDYYIVVSDDAVKASSIKITINNLNYLKFTAAEAGATIKLNKVGSPNSVSLQKSTDGITWSTYNVSDTITLNNVNDSVYFRTTASNASFSKDKSNYYYFSMSKKISASGNIMSLVDNLCKPKTISSNYMFYKLFVDCKTLTTAPELPATTLANYCYQSMFSNCISLVTAPTLPANSLASDCYNSMFYGCSGLVNAPALPAETLKVACYNSMFRNCTSLVSAPTLPATTLANYCYNYMFAGCTSLTIIPEIKATTLANSACNSMFNGCTKIKVHEKQSGENANNNKYEITIPGTSGLTNPVTDMFKGTSGAFTGTPVAGKTYVLDASLSLTADMNNTNPTYGTVGSLKYTIKATNFKTNPTTSTISLTCYSDSALKNKVSGDPFTYTVSGNTLTISSKTTTASGDYYVVVSDDAVKASSIKITISNLNYLKFTAVEAGATIKLNKVGSPNSISLQKSTDGKTWSTYNVTDTITLNNINDCVYFRATTSNATFNKDNANYYYFSMTKKISASGNIMSLIDNTCNSKTISSNYMFYYLFINCRTLTTAPELPATTLANHCYQSMFENCSSIVDAPVLPAKVLTDYCYFSMFEGCSSIVNAPALPATTVSQGCYYHMFDDCTSLVNAPALPADSLVSQCYQSMFWGCTSLVNAPELPAKYLASYCYASMFRDCTSLVNAPTLQATKLSYSCYESMFWGCTSLINIPELKATTLAESCYRSMFNGCTKIKVHEKQSGENINNNKYEITIPNTSGLTNPVTDMFKGTSGSFTGTPTLGKSYILDASLTLTADKNNTNPTYGTVGSLKYTIKVTNFKTNPTTESISITCYSDSTLNNKISGEPFTYTVSGITLTISSKTTTAVGNYYLVVSDDTVSAEPIKIVVMSK